MFPGQQAQDLFECSSNVEGWTALVTLTMESFNVLPVDSLNPFIELEATSFPVKVDTAKYKNAFHLASDYAGTV